MPQRNANLLVISGGPGSGKTTVIHELGKLGFGHAPEVARQIIQEQVATGGSALPWHDRETCTHLMLQPIASYSQHTPASRPTFSDRGIPDTLSYARLIRLSAHDLILGIQTACMEYRYAPIVFLTPPWEEIYRTDNERKQDCAEAQRTFAQVAEVYAECGYQLLELPKINPVARSGFILKNLPTPSS